MDKETYNAEGLECGYHPDGFQIDKSAAPLMRYTKWNVTPNGSWTAPQPVCFHSLPEDGWYKSEKTKD